MGEPKGGGGERDRRGVAAARPDDVPATAPGAPEWRFAALCGDEAGGAGAGTDIDIDIDIDIGMGPGVGAVPD